MRSIVKSLGFWALIVSIIAIGISSAAICLDNKHYQETTRPAAEQGLIGSQHSIAVANLELMDDNLNDLSTERKSCLVSFFKGIATLSETGTPQSANDIEMIQNLLDDADELYYKARKLFNQARNEILDGNYAAANELILKSNTTASEGNIKLDAFWDNYPWPRPEDEDEGLNPLMIMGPIAGIVILALLVYMSVRRQKRDQMNVR